MKVPPIVRRADRWTATLRCRGCRASNRGMVLQPMAIRAVTVWGTWRRFHRRSCLMRRHLPGLVRWRPFGCAQDKLATGLRLRPAHRGGAPGTSGGTGRRGDPCCSLGRVATVGSGWRGRCCGASPLDRAVRACCARAQHSGIEGGDNENHYQTETCNDGEKSFGIPRW